MRSRRGGGVSFGLRLGDYEVIHHTQLLQHLVDEGRLVPVTPVEGIITYHDPCYLGRHNKICAPPRETIGSVPGLRNDGRTRTTPSPTRQDVVTGRHVTHLHLLNDEDPYAIAQSHHRPASTRSRASPRSPA